ncbi:MAG: nucleotidyltransferase substrate binding protein [Sedimenticola sp.]
MNEQDIRWIQRFNNYCRALNQLTRFMEREALNELEEQGLIQSFEYNHELAWNVLKDFLTHQGFTGLIGSRDASREAFRQGLLGDTEESGEVWLKMIKSRNLTSHTYNEEVTRQIVNAIVDEYYDAFVALRERMQVLADAEQE